MDIKVVGLDLAKNHFQVEGVDQRGRATLRRQLRRSQVLPFFANLQPVLIGMEACAGAHYWARELMKLGHTVKLMHPRYVKPYVQTNKNDRADAAAIAEAATRPKVRSVPVKQPWQQDLQSVHRVREQIKRERVAVGNQIRGLLAEFGIVMAQGRAALKRELPQILEDAENGLSAMMRQLLAARYAHFGALEAQLSEYDRMLAQAAKQHESCSALLEVPGIGVLGATALVAKVNDAKHLKNGRQLAASEGLVPRHWGTGGKEWMGHVSKQGDGYIRTIFVEGARAVLRTAPGKTDRLSRWAVQLSARRGPNIAAVALANKIARIAWVILARGQRYQPQ